jgi:hypothetical protein
MSGNNKEIDQFESDMFKLGIPIRVRSVERSRNDLDMHKMDIEYQNFLNYHLTYMDEIVDNIDALSGDKAYDFLRECVKIINTYPDVKSLFNVDEIMEENKKWGTHVIIFSKTQITDPSESTALNENKMMIHYNYLGDKPSRYYQVWLCLERCSNGSIENFPCFNDIL